MNLPVTKLTHVLIGKSIIETLLIGTLAVYTFITILPPFFHGWGEFTGNGISGWAVNNAAPFQRVEVELFIDGKFQALAVADESRPDVPAAGWARDERHGYTFPLAGQSPGSHEARVYALYHSADGVRKSLQMLGSAIPFDVNTDGQPMLLSK
ncbi:MAG: hypothetical protein ABIO36_08050 [Pyrinomonadaceae bacterium]